MTPEEAERLCKGLLEKDLRIQCRHRGLTPAGGKDTLRERVKEHMVSTQDFRVFNEDGSVQGGAGLAGSATDSAELVNNYTRPGGCQNVGNFLTDRPSTFVAQAPGGQSSICFGNAPSEPQKHVANSQFNAQFNGPNPLDPTAGQGNAGGFATNNYARPGGAQNVGNFITDRNSSRVLAPPGGASSIAFG